MNDNRTCPECGGELEYVATWDGKLMYVCDECLCTWQVSRYKCGHETIERYFFG